MCRCQCPVRSHTSRCHLMSPRCRQRSGERSSSFSYSHKQKLRPPFSGDALVASSLPGNTPAFQRVHRSRCQTRAACSRDTQPPARSAPCAGHAGGDMAAARAPGAGAASGRGLRPSGARRAGAGRPCEGQEQGAAGGMLGPLGSRGGSFRAPSSRTRPRPHSQGPLRPREGSSPRRCPQACACARLDPPHETADGARGKGAGVRVPGAAVRTAVAK